MCEENAAGPMNTVKRTNGSRSYDEASRAYCSERDNSQMISFKWQSQMLSPT